MEHDKLISVAVAELDTIPSSLIRGKAESALHRQARRVDKRDPVMRACYKYRISDIPDTLDDPMLWKNIGEQTAPAVRKFLNKHGWRLQSDNSTWIKTESPDNNKAATSVAQAELEGGLDSLIVHKTILNRIIVDLEKFLLRSQEERRRLNEVIETKKKAYSDAFGYSSKYQTDKSQPNDIKEPSGE